MSRQGKREDTEASPWTPGPASGLTIDVRLVSSVVVECGKNKCKLGVVNREIFPLGNSPSAVGFTPQVGIYCIGTGLNLRPEAHGPCDPYISLILTPGCYSSGLVGK